MGLAVRRFLGYVFPHLQDSLALLPGFHCRCETVVIRPRRTMADFSARSGSTDGTSFRAFVNILPCPVCAFLPLFTGVRGRGIPRSSRYQATPLPGFDPLTIDPGAVLKRRSAASW